jgi:hypothetical protein
MSYTLTNVVSNSPINCNVGYNNAWVQVENNADRPLYAQATYVTNFDDLTLTLNAANVDIGHVQIQDPNSDLRVSVVSPSPGVGALVTSISNPTTAVEATIVNSIDAIIKEEPGVLFSFNNHAIASHRGWTMDSTMRPVFSIQNSSADVNKLMEILEYEIGNNNANQSTIMYEWYEGPLNITGSSIPSWSSIGNCIQYRIYQDAYTNGNGNVFTVPSGTHMRHSGIIIGKNTSGDEGPAEMYGGNNRNMLTLCMKRLDSSTKLDIWFAVTCKELL